MVAASRAKPGIRRHAISHDLDVFRGGGLLFVSECNRSRIKNSIYMGQMLAVCIFFPILSI